MKKLTIMKRLVIDHRREMCRLLRPHILIVKVEILIVVLERGRLGVAGVRAVFDVVAKDFQGVGAGGVGEVIG